MRTDSSPSPKQGAAARSLAVDLTTAEVVEAFRRAGIRSILLKGPAIVRWLYDGRAMRIYGDCDLLIAPSDFARAESILVGMGFERSESEGNLADWPLHAHTWVRRHIGVDLHRTLLGVGAGPDKLWEVFAARTEQMKVAGVSVEVPAPDALLLTIALHAAKDGPRVSKVRHDVGHAVERVPFDVWERAASLASVLDARAGLAAGLRLTEGGGDLAERLGLSGELSADVALRMEGGAPPLAVGVDWLLTERGMGRKLKVVLRKTFPPPAQLRAWKPLASRGPAGLAAAYVWRPAWMLWHLGPALAARRRARRAAANSAPRSDGI